MADDNGLIADIEAQMVTLLSAVQLSSKNVFRTVDHFAWQIQSMQDFQRYAPFAFVHYVGTAGTAIEGDYDLVQKLNFSVLLGVEITGNAERARIGKGTDASERELGISRIRDLVITALQENACTTTAGGTEFFRYVGDVLVSSQPNSCLLEMRFQIDRIGDYT